MKALALVRLRLPRLGIGPQIVVTLLVLGLLSAMAIEPTRQLMDQRERIAAMSSDLNEIEHSNNRLEARIERLRNPDFLEQRAREQIGLVRPGETAIVVMPPSKKAGKSAHKRHKADDRPQPADFSFFEGFLNFVGLL
jgi:cell division protein DivIC